jgi:ligand-binding sensor domain-containing protein
MKSGGVLIIHDWEPIVRYFDDENSARLAFDEATPQAHKTMARVLVSDVPADEQ